MDCGDHISAAGEWTNLKPIVLKMTAFGPYKEEEVIDFRKLGEHRLFLISGSTGAGKTTIFDAMSYALYGGASGEDRKDAAGLRSQFATDKEPTSVDFVFALRGEMYRVFRQMATKKGRTDVAELYKYERHEAVDEDGTLWVAVPMLKKASNKAVTERVQELIGLERDQFNQIVMLPQGEFRKLLTSNSDDKEKIFRKIFRTDRFYDAAGRIDQLRSEQRKVYEREENGMKFYMNNVFEQLGKRADAALTEVFAQEQGYNAMQVKTALAEEIQYYETQVGKAQTELNTLLLSVEKTQTAYHEAQVWNEKFARLASVSERYAQLMAEQEQIHAAEGELKLAERALPIIPLDQHCALRAGEKRDAETQLEQVEEGVGRAAHALQVAETAWTAETAHSEELAALQVEIARLEQLEPVVERLAGEMAEGERLGVAVAHAEAKEVALMESLAHVAAEVDTARADLRAQETLVMRLPKVNRVVDQLIVLHRWLSNLLKLWQQWQELSAQGVQLEQQAEQQRIYVAQLEEQWIAGQAGLLAAHLHDGVPCPVCGSSVHPALAHLPAATPDKAELEEARERSNQAQLALFDGQARLHAIAAQWQQQSAETVLADWRIVASEAGDMQDLILTNVLQLMHTDMQGLMQVAAAGAGTVGTWNTGLASRDIAELPGTMGIQLENALQAVQQAGEACRQEQQQLVAKEGMMTVWRTALTQSERRLEQLRSDREQAVEQLNKQRVMFAVVTEKQRATLAELPPHTLSLAALQQQLKRQQANAQHMERRMERVRKELQSASELVAVSRERLVQAQVTRDEAQRRYHDAQRKLTEALEEAAFATHAEYLAATRTSTERVQLREHIQRYQTDVFAAQQQRRALQTELAGHEIVDLTKLVGELQAVQQASEQTRSTAQRLEQKLSAGRTGMEHILQAEAQTNAALKQYTMLQDLYDAVHGKNNLKISFERYVQMDFMERVIQHANLRLHRLSRGQFYLVRSERREQGNKQGGLSLDVFDHYTGQERDVKTLSGGEKFNASLSLALGLADVIQAYSGTVALEAMFIDEGFGSLDEESLNQAIDTLVELQQAGRLIGVISHVEELRRTIPAVLEVTKTAEGYSHAQFVLK
jgi:exonuclease SbcC